MTTSASSAVTPLLRAVAVLQALAIALLAVLLLGADDVAPAHASPPGAAPPHANAANPAHAPTPPAAGREQRAATAPAPLAPAAADARTAATGTLLYGRVVDEAGAAVPQAIVWFSRAEDSKQLATVRIDQKAPTFAIAGLPAGELTFRTRATGYQEQGGTLRIPAGEVRLRHDIVLAQAWVLAVKILTPEGVPVQSALREAAKQARMLHFVEVAAIVTPTRPEGDFPPTGLRQITNGLGRWRGGGPGDPGGAAQTSKDVAGVIEIDRKQPLWVSAVLRHRVLASVSVEPGQPEVTLTVGVDQVLRDLGTIRGRIVDESGAPVADANIGFGDQQSGGMNDKADANARFEVTHLRPGLLTMSIHSGDRYSGGTMVLLQPGQELDLGDVPLRTARVIKGRCEGLVGKADACRISCTPLDPPSHPSLRSDRGGGSVVADGTFTLHLLEGRYIVRASGAGGAVTEIDTRMLGEQPLVLQLAKETSLRLDVQTNGAPMELAMFDAGGREVYRRDLQHGWKFALPFLPGDYRVELKDGRGKVETRRIQLGDAGADLRVP